MQVRWGVGITVTLLVDISKIATNYIEWRNNITSNVQTRIVQQNKKESNTLVFHWIDRFSTWITGEKSATMIRSRCVPSKALTFSPWNTL